ncbi:MAG: bifunctional riboflavin kinase/FAD synthetase [Bacteroidota bacterium]|nr:MAG: bifunctional riboflavin kinase/FAD synthetase [Bacteroidota bacterium]
MKLYKDLSAEIPLHTVATIGIFDGVHLAHQQIIRRLDEIKKKYQTLSTLVTLWPHPRYVLNKDAAGLQLLSTLEEKLLRLEHSGIDQVLLIPFSAEFAALPYDVFIHRVLVEKLRVRHLVVGFNHHFGKDRQGSYESLCNYGQQAGFTTEQLQKIEIDGEGVSSSRIRQFILHGDLEHANLMLGYPYTVSGNVIHGNKLGRAMGFPTANIELPEIYKLLPAEGVYAIETNIDGKLFKGMLNIGTRPTVDNRGHKVMEANFFDLEQDLYDKHLTLHFFKRIRAEKKFENLDLLKKQIETDRIEILNYFNKKKH